VQADEMASMRVTVATEAGGCRSKQPLRSQVDRARRGGSGALYPQSALAGPKSPLRGFVLVVPPLGRRWLGSRAVSAREPGQVRKEAALSDHRQAQRELPGWSCKRRSGDCGAASRGGARSICRPLRSDAVPDEQRPRPSAPHPPANAGAHAQCSKSSHELLACAS
jgi:hypothetical protein